MSNWDYIDEVDIIPKLPPNFDELRESKKWQERKEALEALLKVLTDNERLSTKVSYAELIGNIQTILAKDANINCQALAAKCIAKFATGLRAKFSAFATPLLPVIFEKMKEKKPTLREPLVECAMEVGRTMTSLEAGQEDVLAALAKPNPQIKQQTALFVARQLDLVAPAKQPKGFIKAVVPVLGKLTGDADQDVREAALQALGSIQRIIGDKNIKSLLGDLGSDETKIKKISEFSDKSAASYAEEQAKLAPEPSRPAAATSSEPSAAAQSAAQPVEAAEADPWDFLDPFDLLGKMPDAFDTNIESKKWQERKEALEGLLQLLSANPKLDPKGGYGGLVEKLQKVLEKDANINVAALAANCIAGLANGLRSKFQQFAISVAPIIFEKFKEKKPTLRDPLVACIDAVVATTSLEALGEIVLAALSKPNPSIKTQTDLFLKRTFMGLNSQTMPKKTLKTLIPSLIKHSGDSDSEVRDASYAAMGAMMRAIGEKPSLQLLADIVSDNLKMGKIKEYHQKALAEAGPAEIAAMVQSIHKADAPPASSAPPKKTAPPKRQEPEEEETEETEEEPLKLPAGEKKKEEKKKAAPAKENAENEPPVTPKSEQLLNDNNEKAQRIKEEKQLKLVKWNFQSPTDEHITQLQTLLGNQAKVSLMSQLFHKDFKQHLAALDTLIRLADTSPRCLLANSDLLLKWCTLRFFETNPAALIKVLELCRVLVELTRDTETQMTTEELTAFVPYLLLKTGEPKENMRTAVREIINTLTDIVGPLKMTPMLLEALKSKNARQRSECLLVIESYISSAGIAPLKSLTVEKIVAPLVGDKDVNVRNAAINVLVACFKFEGDQMWKAAGRMADKDKSLVEERIKRSGVKGGTGVASPNGGGGAKIVVPQQNATVRRPASRSRTRHQEEEEEEETARYEKPQATSAARSRYALREDVASSAIETLKNAFNVVSTPQAPVASSWANTTFQMKRTNSSSSISSIDTSDNIQRSINNISSGLQDVAQDAMYQVTYVLNQPEQRHLVDRRADLVFRASAAQLDMVVEDFTAGKDVTATMEACTQMLFILMGGVDSQTGLEPLNASPETVKAIITSVLRGIIQIGSSDTGHTMARSLNRLAMRLIYRVELSNLLCGLILAMTESIQQDTKITDLVSKLSSKWCDELEKRRSQLRASDIVEVFNGFYICTLAERKMDISHPHVLVVDNYLERVILQQGDVILDAARRLGHPHMHLTSMINKILQMMKEQSIAPIMPGTLDPRGAPQEEEGVVVRSGIIVCVHNILRDPGNASRHMAELIRHAEGSEASEYAQFLVRHPCGPLISALKQEFEDTGGRLVLQNPQVVERLMMMYDLSCIHLGAPPEDQMLTPQKSGRMDATLVGTPLSRGGDATITRSRGNMIRPKRTTNMTKEKLADIKMQLERVKNGN